jgi:hypothetical protein
MEGRTQVAGHNVDQVGILFSRALVAMPGVGTRYQPARSEMT